jgi:hypothetical protein
VDEDGSVHQVIHQSCPWFKCSEPDDWQKPIQLPLIYLISCVLDDKAGTEPFFPLIVVCREILRAAQFPIRAPMQLKPQDFQQPSLPMKGLAIGARRGAPRNFNAFIDLLVENQIATRWQHSQSGSNRGFGHSHGRHLAKLLAKSLHVLDPSSRSLDIVFRDTKREVCLGLRPEVKPHAGRWPESFASSRARTREKASLPSVARPLAMPASHCRPVQR